MSKTQKIILFIGIGLIGASLVLLLVNTILKTQNTNKTPDQTDTNLFSLFEKPVTVNEKPSDTEEVSGDPQTNESVLADQLITKNQALISEEPVLNFIPIEKIVDQISFSPDKKTPDTKLKKYGVRYIKYDGVVYEKYDGEIEQRVSNTTTARIGEAFLYKDNIVYRYSREDMQTIETYIGTISKKEPTIGNVTGGYLPKNIRSFTVDESTGKFAGLLSDESRQSAQILVGNVGKNERSTLLKTSFTDWLIEWLDESNLVLTSRPSGKVVGVAYIVNTKDLSKIKVFSDVGLTTKVLPFKAGLVVSSVIDGKYNTKIYQNKKLGYLPLNTVADKCTATSPTVVVCAVAGSISGTLPDDWYKGELNYQDTIISYNTETGTQKILLNGNIDVDIIKPSSDGSFIYFRNKINGLLYRVKVI